MSDLRENYTDDELDTSVNLNRTFTIRDSQGNVIAEDCTLEETTAFIRQGDNFGANDINATNHAVNGLSTNLSDNGDSFKFLSQNGKYGFEDPNGNFKAFSGGAILLGEYSTDTTIDVSALGATSADQFLIVPSQSMPQETYWNGPGNIYICNSDVGFQNGSLALNNNLLQAGHLTSVLIIFNNSFTFISDPL